MSFPPADLECRNAVLLASDLIEGVLPTSDLVDLELHLTICADCSAVMDRMRYVVGLLASRPRPSLSTDDRARLKQFLEPLLAERRARSLAGGPTL